MSNLALMAFLSLKQANPTIFTTLIAFIVGHIQVSASFALAHRDQHGWDYEQVGAHWWETEFWICDVLYLLFFDEF